MPNRATRGALQALRACGILLAGVVLAPRVAGALAIDPLEDLRSLSANVGNTLQGQFDSETASPPAPFAAWTRSVDASVSGKNGYASQTSSIGADTLSGQGSASASAGGALGGASAGTSYRIRFTLGSPSDFTLTGLLVGSPFVMGGGGSGSASAKLTGPGGAVVLDLATPFVLSGTPQLTLAHAGLLPAGDYELLVAASSSAGAGLTGGGGSASTSFQFTFSVLPVPEPGSAALVAAGAVALCLRRPRAGPRPTR